MADVTVEYNRRGEWQWVRRPSLRNRTGYVAYELGTSHRRHSNLHSRSQHRKQRTPNDFPPFPEIEKLIRFYVMTGEGRGSFRAAEQSEARQDMTTHGTSERRRYLAHGHRYGFRRDSSSSDSPPDDHDIPRPSAPAGPVPGSGYGRAAGPRVRIPHRPMPMRPPPGYVNSPSRLDSRGDYHHSRETEEATTDDAFLRRRTSSSRQETHVNVEDDDYYRPPKFRFRPSRVSISRPEMPSASSAPVEPAAGASSSSAQQPPIVISDNRPDIYDNNQGLNEVPDLEVEEEVVLAVGQRPAHRRRHGDPVLVYERPQAPVRHDLPNIPRPPPPQPPPPRPVVSGGRPRPYQFGYVVGARPNIQVHPRPVRPDGPARVIEVRPPPRAQQRPGVDHAHPPGAPSGWASVPRPPPPSGRVRRQHQAYVESEGSEDDQDFMATVPTQEQDYREMAGVRQRRNFRRQSRIVEVEAEGRQQYFTERGGSAMRGGHISSSELDEPPPSYSSDDDDDEGSYFGRLRGGAITPPFPPTKTAAIAAGVLPSPSVMDNTTQKDIFLIFFTVSRGKIVTSQMWVTYTTFQEILHRHQPNQRAYPNIKDPTQLSDQWFINKLFEHYGRINRQQQTIWWDIISIRTIGFASFIRFEQYDPNIDTAYSVTAKVPAITARPEDAMSKFGYLLKHPFKRGKMMLYNLDRLAATTAKNVDPNTAGPDRAAFYAVEIKEAINTRKMYLLLVSLIVISTAGGATFAVLREDISTGLSIATYILTCLSLMLALAAAGQWFGLSKPDSFSFAYDMDINQILGVKEEK